MKYQLRNVQTREQQECIYDSLTEALEALDGYIEDENGIYHATEEHAPEAWQQVEILETEEKNEME